MESEHLKELSAELKEAREKAELTLEEISSKTRIDIKYLKAIEDANFDIMPDVYMRAFIKEYAKQCKLNPEEVSKKYESAKQGKPINKVEDDSEGENSEETSKKKTVKKEFSDDKPSPEKTHKSKFKFNKPTIITAIVLVIILAIVAYFSIMRDSSPEIVVERPFEEVLEEKTQKEQTNRFEIDEESPSSENVSATQDSLTLSLQAEDTCWVQAVIDEELEREFMLYKNSSTTVKAAKRFDLIIGNSGGIELNLNGKKLPLEGKKGERKTFSIDRNGIIQ